jgi:Ca2+-binding EF-hand superfamily protein
MRKKLIGLFLLAGFAGVLLIPALGVAQFGQQGQDPQGGKKGKKGNKGDANGFPGGGGGKKGGFGGKGGGGFGGMNIDPDSIFNMMANGGNSIVIANSGMLRPQLEQWADQSGNTTGMISRVEFSNFMTSQLQNMGGFGGKGGGMGGFGGGFGGGQGGGNYDPDQAATTRFNKFDKDGDGFLDPDEMPDTIKDIWQQYDTNRDGRLSLEEYKALYRDVTGQRGGGQNNNGMGAAGGTAVEDDWEARPTVYRAGKLPKELPDWFRQMDTDRDGQVGLYEWRASGKSIDEFKLYDRNGDGLLTAEEVLGYMKTQMAMYSGGSMANGFSMAQMGQPGMGKANFGPNSFGGPKGKGKGKGGPDGGGGGKGGGGKGGGKGGGGYGGNVNGVNFSRGGGGDN